MRIDINGTIVSNDDKWIYDYFDMEAVCPGEVKKAIQAADGVSGIDVYINSGGGDVFAGSEIYSELRAYKGNVRIHITGLAASAASVIACAGASDITPTGMFMVHNVSAYGVTGDYNAMDKQSEILKQANRAIAAAYVEKTGMTEAEALKLMNNETWLSAADAVEKGLIDKIAESQNVRLAASYTNMLPQAVIEKIRNTVRCPRENNADFLTNTFQAKLDLLKLKGGI